MIREVSTALAVFALAWAITAPTPGHAADVPCAEVRLLCSGFEPNWRFTLDGTMITFLDPESPNGLDNPLVLPACAMTVSGARTDVTAGGPLDLEATVAAETCIQPNEEVWPFSVDATFNQGRACNARPGLRHRLLPRARLKG